MIAAEPPPPPLPPSSERSPWPFGKFPGPKRKKKIFIIIGGIVVAAVIIAAILATISSTRQNQQTTISEFAPKVKFIKFDAEKHDLQVGQSTKIIFNIQNSEDRVINDAKVVVTIDPEVGNNYLSISNNTIKLPSMNTQNWRYRSHAYCYRNTCKRSSLRYQRCGISRRDNDGC